MFAPRNSSPPLSQLTNSDDMAAHQVTSENTREIVSGGLVNLVPPFDHRHRQKVSVKPEPKHVRLNPKCKQLRNSPEKCLRSNFEGWCKRETTRHLLSKPVLFVFIFSSDKNPRECLTFRFRVSAAISLGFGVTLRNLHSIRVTFIKKSLGKVNRKFREQLHRFLSGKDSDQSIGGKKPAPIVLESLDCRKSVCSERWLHDKNSTSELSSPTFLQI